MAEKPKHRKEVINMADLENQQRTEGTENKPTVEELMAQLEEAKAENARNKSALDKALKEKGDITKQLRAKQTDDELALAKQQELADHYAAIENELKVSKAQARYVAMGMDIKMAFDTAQAEIEGNFDTVTSNFNKLKELSIKAAQAEWLKSRPEPQAGGNGAQLTKEQFDKMSLVERSQLYTTNPEAYKQFSGK